MRASHDGLIAINDRDVRAARRPRAAGRARAMARAMVGALAFAGALTIGLAAPAAAPVDGHVVRVLDGDSLLVRFPGAGIRGVRIAGIDAPEKGQPYADVSRRALLERLDDREVRIDVIKTDPFDRLVGRVFVAERDAGLAQLRAGLAWHFVRYDADLTPAVRRRYAQAERQARLRGLGLWRDPDPLPPWEHRARARGLSPRAPSSGPGAGAAR